MVLAACLAGTGPAAVAVTTPREQKAEDNLFRLINKGRVNHALLALIEHGDIRSEARDHSVRMADNGALSHVGFDARRARIANGDAGIDQDKICELVARARTRNPDVAARLVYRAWKRAARFRQCMFDRDFTTQSGAVGVELRDDTYWFTFIAAHDDTP
jgi:uncharacterized protein YkwD